MRESAYRSKVIEKLMKYFPGCVIIPNDPRHIQGIPDLLILFGDKWAMLEVKTSESASVRPNQRHYVEAFGLMSYCAFIYPENEETVFNDLQHALFDNGSTRFS
jgi:hypothetical protein